MLHGPSEDTELLTDESTKEFGNFAGEEVTGNFTKRPLSYFEFSSWNMDECTDETLPVWLVFFEKFNAYSSGEGNELMKENWFLKVKENEPDIFNEIVKTINEFKNFNEDFINKKIQNKIISNVTSINPRLLLIKIESLLYQAYKEARKYVDDDKYLFVKNYKPVISFEEFSRLDEIKMFDGKTIIKAPRHNNFYLRFCMWGHYQNKPEVKAIQTEIPEIYSKLSETISNYFLQKDIYEFSSPSEKLLFNLQEPDLMQILGPLQGDLYRAYLVARKYTDYDDELFA